MPRSSATRFAWTRALAIEMCGSRPEADAVTASTGTDGVRPEAVELAVGLDAVDDDRRDLLAVVVEAGLVGSFTKHGFVGPRFEPRLSDGS